MAIVHKDITVKPSLAAWLVGWVQFYMFRNKMKQVTRV